jgi:hypothetical protein
LVELAPDSALSQRARRRSNEPAVSQNEEAQSSESAHHARNEMIIAILSRGRARQVIGLVDLPLPLRRTEGIEWIKAYRRFVQDSEA